MNETDNFKNTLYTNDNLYVLRRLDSESVDLIYLDPPFNSKRIYENPIGADKKVIASFKDIWTWDEDVDKAYLAELAKTKPELVRYIMSIGELHSESMMAYITYMAQRVIEMHRVLKPTGSIYYHCDQTAGHYVKLMLDGIFGKENFRNEIVWCYSTSGRSKKCFSKKHDSIFFYTKNDDYYWNSDFRIPYDEEYIRTHFKEIDKDGKLIRKRVDAGKERIYYASEGMIPNDWWNIPYVNSMSDERTGYPTQKPLALLDRIIKASCPERGIVLDPFCGCATTCVSAEHLGIKWIGIDISQTSANLVAERLKDAQGLLFENFVHRYDLPTRHDLKLEKLDDNPTKKQIKEKLYKQQEQKCNGCGNCFDIYNLEIDHIFPRSKGGEDNIENLQLLCGHCNRVKGDRPMEYLKIVIKSRQDVLTYKLSYGKKDN